MPIVYDRETGARIDAAPEDAQAGLVAGQYALDAAGPKVRLQDQDGRVFLVDPSKASDTLAGGGYSLLGHEEESRRQTIADEKAKGFGGSLDQGVESAANQFLLGIPETYIEATETPEERAHRETVQQYHQAARLLGGAVGVGGSLLAGGGLFKGAELAGQAVERGILPAAELAEATLGRRLAATAASYATQGAVMSAPTALIQAAAGDPKKAAETMLWGIGLSGALGAGAELFGGAVSKAAGAAVSAEGRDRLDAFANARLLKAMGAERGALNRLSDERPGQLADYAFDEGLIKPGMSRADVAMAIDKAHAANGAKIGEAIDALDGLLAPESEAKQAAMAGAIKPGDIGAKLRAALDTPELRMPMNRDQAGALQLVIDSADLLPTREVSGQQVVSFRDAQDFVSSLRKKWVGAIGKAQNEGGARGLETVTALDSMKAAAYGVARDAVHEAGDRVAAASEAPELVGRLAEAKAAYSKTAQLEQFAASIDRQAAGNRLVGLTDMIHMGHGVGTGVAAGAGAGIGGLLGGPAGAVVGATVGKVPGMALDLLAKHWMEDKGLVALGAMSKRAAREGPAMFAGVLASEGASRLAATMKLVPDTIRRMAIGGLVRTEARKQEHMGHLLGSTSGLTPEQAFARLSSRLTTLASSPDALSAATSALSGPIAAASPALADAYQQQLLSTIHYLYESIPKPTAPAAPFAPDPWSASRKDMIAFHDRAEIVANPMAALRHVESGTLSSAHVHALQTVYPSILSEMQSAALTFGVEHPDVKLPLAERQSLSVLLGADLGANGEKVRAIQAAYAPAPRSDGKPLAKGKLDKLPQQGSAFSSTQGPSSTGA